MTASPELRQIAQSEHTVRLFLCGDVMSGRGIDQILGHPCSPELHESYVHSAIDYVRLAEKANGPIPRHVDPSYIWGTALDELERARPDARIVNLETSITRSDAHEEKGINYRMSPENATCLAAAAIDCCVLANNHVLDWGRQGLLDTLATLASLKINSVGAGRNLAKASGAPILDIAGKTRLLVFAFGVTTSGIPHHWASTPDTAGVNLLDDLSDASVARIADMITRRRQPDDIVVVSIHWGPNWGYDVSDQQQRFAHALIDTADVSIVHGHSSHHAKAIEVYRNRLVLYGCGDFLNDYEGIGGYEAYRGDLPVMYFADIDTTDRNLVALDIVPLQIRQFRLVRPGDRDIDWIAQTLDRECRQFGARVKRVSDERLSLSWPDQTGPHETAHPRRAAV
jgi:poly-gamma-glutamate capsule biosynthesis protein CapA/YwtB (metallophosphatase superfamily)